MLRKVMIYDEVHLLRSTASGTHREDKTMVEAATEQRCVSSARHKKQNKAKETVLKFRCGVFICEFVISTCVGWCGYSGRRGDESGCS